MAELYSLVGSTYDLLQDRRLHHITTDKLLLFYHWHNRLRLVRLVCLFLFLAHFDVICDLLLNRPREYGSVCYWNKPCLCQRTGWMWRDSLFPRGCAICCVICFTELNQQVNPINESLNTFMFKQSSTLAPHIFFMGAFLSIFMYINRRWF